MHGSTNIKYISRYWACNNKIQSHSEVALRRFTYNNDVSAVACLFPSYSWQSIVPKLLWRWRQQVSPKHRLTCTNLNRVISRTTWIFNTDARSSSLAWYEICTERMYRSRTWRWPLTPFWCHSHERVELYLYSLYGPYGLYRASVPVQGFKKRMYRWAQLAYGYSSTRLSELLILSVCSSPFTLKQ
jgi:hypothetical protein